MEKGRKVRINISPEERIKRIELRLPITKQLVYYDTDKNKYNIVSYNVYEEHKSYKTIEVELENNKKVKIHEAYLREMQRPDFERYIEELIKNNYKEGNK